MSHIITLVYTYVNTRKLHEVELIVWIAGPYLGWTWDCRDVNLCMSSMSLWPARNIDNSTHEPWSRLLKYSLVAL